MQRDDIGVEVAQSLRRGADRAPARQEREHVALRLRECLARGVGDPRIQVFGRRHGARLPGHMARLDRVAAAGRLEVARAQVLGQAAAGEGRRREHEAVAVRGPEQRQQQVRVPAPLVELVEHDGGEAGEAVGREPAQRDAGCDEQHAGIRAVGRVEAHGIADRAARFLAPQARDVTREAGRGDPPRLDDQHGPVLTRPHRQTRRLARARRRRDHDVARRKCGVEVFAQLFDR